MELIQEIKKQKKQVKTFLVKLIIFVALVFVVDRGLNFFLKEGMYRYFGLDKSAEVLLIGHSHTVLGIDKETIEDKLNITVAKYARAGANLLDRKLMIQHYFKLHPKSAKIVIYDVNAHLFTKGGLSRNSYKLFYPFMDMEVVNNHILAASPEWDELIIRNTFKTSRYSEMLIAQSMRGWLKKWTNFKSGTVDIERLEKEISSGISRKIELNEKSIALFKETLELIKEEGATVVLAYIPTIDILNESEPVKYKETIEFFEKVAKDDKNIYFFDYNIKYAHQHDLFFDPVHLNPKGQKIVTKEIVHHINMLEKVNKGNEIK